MFLFSGSIFNSLEDKSLPLSVIEPFFIFSSPAIVLSIVVLPIPEGPRRQIISPSFSIEKDTFLTLFFSPIMKSTFLISKKLLLIFS